MPPKLEVVKKFHFLTSWWQSSRSHLAAFRYPPWGCLRTIFRLVLLRSMDWLLVAEKRRTPPAWWHWGTTKEGGLHKGWSNFVGTNITKNRNLPRACSTSAYVPSKLNLHDVYIYIYTSSSSSSSSSSSPANSCPSGTEGQSLSKSRCLHKNIPRFASENNWWVVSISLKIMLVLGHHHQFSGNIQNMAASTTELHSPNTPIGDWF